MRKKKIKKRSKKRDIHNLDTALCAIPKRLSLFDLDVMLLLMANNMPQGFSTRYGAPMVFGKDRSWSQGTDVDKMEWAVPAISERVSTAKPREEWT